MSYKHSSMSTCGVDQRRKAAGRRGQSIINRLSPAEIKAIEQRINRYKDLWKNA